MSHQHALPAQRHLLQLCTRCHSRPRRGPTQRWCRECRALMQRLARERTRTAKTTLTPDALRNAPPVPSVCDVPAKTAPTREEAIADGQ
jgi:hypothetical protein